VLNHKRLLDSARSDPSAVSFQLRPVDVVSGSDLAKRPSFGSLDTLQFHHEVRGRGMGCAGEGRSSTGRCLPPSMLTGWPQQPLRATLPPSLELTPAASTLHLPLPQALTNSYSPHKLAGGRPLPRPAFGSSPNLQASACRGVASCCRWQHWNTCAVPACQLPWRLSGTAAKRGA
jgi:hypothetical protein